MRPVISRVMLLLLLGVAAVHAAAKETKVHGYVTNVLSPTQFEIEDYRVDRQTGFKLEFDNTSPELTFDPENLRVGVEVEVKGLYDPNTGVLNARSIKVDMEQFKKEKHTAVLAQLPQGVVHGEDGWSGTFFADGQRIRVSRNTAVVFALTGRERELLKKQRPDMNAADEFRPLATLDEVTTGTMMTYEGARSVTDGTIIAERVEFMHNELEKGEQELWSSLKVDERPFDRLIMKPGELKISNIGKFKTLPDEDVQNYANEIGRRLIPAYQTVLADTDQSKIPFHFYVVDKKEANAFATPNGLVVINSGLFRSLENEAQFAAVIGHEVSHSIQRHVWFQQQHHKNVRTLLGIASIVASVYGKYNLSDLADLTEGAIRNGYSRNLENQADRIGLEYMVEAGYDPREAPRVWKQMTKAVGDAPTDFFWSNHDNNATRRSYLMNELKNNYAQADYSRLKTNREAFAVISAKVLASEQKSKR